MNWQEGLLVVIVLACVVPAIFALIPRKPEKFEQRDHVAARHRAIANRAVRTRAGLR